MVASLILVLSVAALVRFGIAQWRSIWQTVADQPLSESLQTVTGIAANAIGPDDFDLFAKLCNESAHPAGESSVWLKEVRLYYRFLRVLRNAGSKTFPSLAHWTESELVTCSRYAGAVLDRRLSTNFAYASVTSNR
jgi:hypothetical protein